MATAKATAFTPAARWTFRLSNPQTRDRESGWLTLGRFTPPADALALMDGRTISSVTCAVDRERDLVAPGHFELRNDNTDFAQAISLGLIAFDLDTSRDFSGATRFDVDARYSSGPSCLNVGMIRDINDGSRSQLELGSGSPVAPGASVHVDFYIILHGLRSPAQPAGDLGRVRQLGMLPNSTSRVIDAWTGPTIHEPLVTGNKDWDVPFSVLTGCVESWGPDGSYKRTCDS
jgi:hypothetical protein